MAGINDPGYRRGMAGINDPRYRRGRAGINDPGYRSMMGEERKIRELSGG
jgi:hypothetical protein